LFRLLHHHIDTVSKGGAAMAKDDKGREGITLGAIAKELQASPAAVKKALAELKMEADFTKGACSYFYLERVQVIKKALK
jgi:hypothetical protein